MNALLRELGNSAAAIPYYAVFRPEKDPIHFNGVFWTPNSFIDKIGRENLTSGKLKSDKESDEKVTVENAEIELLDDGASPPGKP